MSCHGSGADHTERPDRLAGRIRKAAGEGTVSGRIVTVIEEHLAEGAELERRFDERVAARPPVDEEITRQVDEEIGKALGARRRRGAA